MVELVGVNDSREINDGKLLLAPRDDVVVEAKSEEVEDVLLVDEVEEVVEAEVDEDEVVIGDELVEEVVGDELVEKVVEDELVEDMVENKLVEKKVVAGGNVEGEVIERDGMVEQKDKDKGVEEVWIAD